MAGGGRDARPPKKREDAEAMRRSEAKFSSTLLPPQRRSFTGGRKSRHFRVNAAASHEYFFAPSHWRAADHH